MEDFTLYLFLRPPVCRRAISTNTCSGTKIKWQHSLPKKVSKPDQALLSTPVRMCYDTSTSPKSFCSDRKYFRELLIYDTPKLVSLADPDLTTKVLGQGIMDIIINDQYPLWIFAYLTENSDLLMSAVNHLSYKGCKINGKKWTNYLNPKEDKFIHQCFNQLCYLSLSPLRNWDHLNIS